MEKQFEALTKQLAALAVVNQPRNRSPTLRFVEEDEVDYNVEDEDRKSTRLNSSHSS